MLNTLDSRAEKGIFGYEILSAASCSSFTVILRVLHSWRRILVLLYANIFNTLYLIFTSVQEWMEEKFLTCHYSSYTVISIACWCNRAIDALPWRLPLTVSALHPLGVRLMFDHAWKNNVIEKRKREKKRQRIEESIKTRRNISFILNQWEVWTMKL